VTDIDMRIAVASDAPRIVKLVSRAFDSSFIDRSIYCAHGIQEFLKRQIHFQTLGGESRFFVAERLSTIVAMVEIRRLPEMCFINMVAVDPSIQGQGIGRAILQYALGFDTSSVELGLDVRVQESRVRDWYIRWGLSCTTSCNWWSLPQRKSEKSWFTLKGMPQAMSLYEIFGFCQFKVVTDCGQYNVGMLGTNWFRIDDVQALTDAGLTSALAEVDSSRKVLAVLPGNVDDMQFGDSAKLLDSTVRMVGKLVQAVEHLSV